MVRLKAGKYSIPVEITKENNRLFFNFPYNKNLMEEIKNMKGRKYHGFDEVNPRKVWSIPICQRNLFQLNYLAGKNPYSRYDSDLITDGLEFTRPVYSHQIEMIAHGLQRRQGIISGEMGTGKTLAGIEIIERSGFSKWLWVGPKATLPAIHLEFRKWNAKVIPEFMTYDRLRINNQQGTLDIYDGVFFDESTKVKTPTALRSEAAANLVEAMRENNSDCFILLMSGAPAPRAPTDWWHQCEIACPGFLVEGDIHKFKNRLAIIVEKESVTGGTYPELVSWLDDERKCAVCGSYPEDHNSQFDLVESGHNYKSSVNEVYKLYERMKGLVLVKRKKDCLDLPELQFTRINIEPTKDTIRAASLIVKTATRAIQALIQLREISDGFQYTEREDGQKVCERCNGLLKVIEYDEDGKQVEEECSKCHGKGTQPKIVRDVAEVPCPKDQVVIDQLDAHEDIGRLVISAGFQASVDRCVNLALRYKWHVIRLDGRGWAYYNETGNPNTDLDNTDLLELFQNPDKNNLKICFVLNPGAGGMGLTLTASPTILCYSNSYNPEDRLQLINRIHRPGMDYNRGATIIDIMHLPIDEKILLKLEQNEDLQNLTLGELKEYIGVD